jgi:hypothetical protein
VKRLGQSRNDTVKKRAPVESLPASAEQREIRENQSGLYYGCRTKR